MCAALETYGTFVSVYTASMFFVYVFPSFFCLQFLMQHLFSIHWWQAVETLLSVCWVLIIFLGCHFLLPLVHCARETCLSNLAVREFANFLLLLLVKSTRSLFIFILQLILFSVWWETLCWIVYECGSLLAVYGTSKSRCHLLAVCLSLYAVLF